MLYIDIINRQEFWKVTTLRTDIVIELMPENGLEKYSKKLMYLNWQRLFTLTHWIICECLLREERRKYGLLSNELKPYPISGLCNSAQLGAL